MGGQRIDDHGSWVGTRGKHTVYPDGAKTKEVSSSDGFGALSMYEDTNEKIVHAQKLAVKKVHGHPREPYHRY